MPPDKFFSDKVLDRLESSRKSPLFETPIAHFLIRAFLTDSIDAFLAHVMVIEAALGLVIDHEGKNRRKFTLEGKTENYGATVRVKMRLAGLLRDKECAKEFQNLFDLRSEYIHGCVMKGISRADDVLARRIARRTVAALAEAAHQNPDISSRADFLEKLLDEGAKLF